MLGIASFLLIYGAVNISHLKLYKKTSAKLVILIASTISCIVFLDVLTYYELINSPITLLLLIAVVTGCFIFEWIYRKRTKRLIKTRT